MHRPKLPWVLRDPKEDRPMQTRPLLSGPHGPENKGHPPKCRNGLPREHHPWNLFLGSGSPRIRTNVPSRTCSVWCASLRFPACREAARGLLGDLQMLLRTGLMGGESVPG
jgi:hypothetical protein